MKNALKKQSDSEYLLQGDGVWLTVGTLSVHIVKTDEGVITDIYALGGEENNAIASTYAFFNERE